jgi:hypothetical protein
MRHFSPSLDESSQSSSQSTATTRFRSKLQYLGMAGFLFFAVKGIIWLVLGAVSFFLYLF